MECVCEVYIGEWPILYALIQPSIYMTRQHCILDKFIVLVKPEPMSPTQCLESEQCQWRKSCHL